MNPNLTQPLEKPVHPDHNPLVGGVVQQNFPCAATIIPVPFAVVFFILGISDLQNHHPTRGAIEVAIGSIAVIAILFCIGLGIRQHNKFKETNQQYKDDVAEYNTTRDTNAIKLQKLNS